MKTILILLQLAVFLTACELNREVGFKGRTMGTTYQVKVVVSYLTRTKGLEQKIEHRLEQINQSMSTYRHDSEISRFNTFEKPGEAFAVSTDFFRVLKKASDLYHLTAGAWDGTVMPLVNLWGFGPQSPPAKLPSAREIKKRLESVGFRHIHINPQQTLVKQRAGITLDLASIAKGYGVDAVSRVILDNGIDNFLVEIGGEVYASGRRLDGNQWRIGISRPDPAATPDQLHRTVPLEGMALATSGDYRNFFEIGGRRYSHLIDPRTGYPVSNGVVSATVLAGNCTLADGLATAVAVMGQQRGLALVESLDGVESMIVVRQSDGTLTDYYSSGLKPPPS